MPAAHTVIVVYRPKAGQEDAAIAVLRRHLDALRPGGYVTGYPQTLLRAADGAILEIFEWTSADVVQRAHTDPAVTAYWNEVGAVCDYATLASLDQAASLFANFERLY
jgi:adenylate kinase